MNHKVCAADDWRKAQTFQETDVTGQTWSRKKRRNRIQVEVEMTGLLARSMAGHDKEKLYVIIGEEGEYVYLADGRNRTVEKPKRKNRKHIQLIKKVQIEEPQGGYRDLEIQGTIKKYQEETNVKG